ncbi:MAG TPA: hypothetical protein PLL54_02660 [Dermatophilaceae bacterium]|nr:hypothetical protein [Dermatophilaceae bacterium]
MSAHLTDELSGYVDRRLPAPRLLAWDRHVAVCPQCRYAVAEERRLLTSLREGPVPAASASLHALLLQVAASASGEDSRGGPRPGGADASGGIPGIPRPPWSPLGGGPRVADPRDSAFRLPTVPPRAPAHHRSLRRTAVVVGLVAGASAAAAWTLGGVAASPLRSPADVTASLTEPTPSLVPPRQTSIAQLASTVDLLRMPHTGHTGAPASFVTPAPELP